MSYPNISSTTLKGLIKFVEKREALQSELAKVESQISAAIGGSTVTSKIKVAPKAKRGKRGALKELLLAELKAAGKIGASVKDLSSKLGVKNQNLHVWFNTTGKRIAGLKKMGPGQWVLS